MKRKIDNILNVIQLYSYLLPTRKIWCPISPIPAKKIANDLDSCIVLGDIANRSFAMGRNTCIDEIERN